MKNTKNALNTIEEIGLYYLILFYPTLISIGRFIPFVETILTFVILIVLIFKIIIEKKYIIKYMTITILLILSSFMCLQREAQSVHIKMILIFFLSFDCFKLGLYERINKLIKSNTSILILQIIIIWLFSIIFLFIPNGYSSNYSSSWGLNAYQGIYTDPHQASYHFCALLIILLIISKNKFNLGEWILFLGFEYCNLMTGARVPTVLGLFIGVIYFINNKIRFIGFNKILNEFFSYVPLIILGIIALFFILFNTSFGEKIFNTSSKARFDNGRSWLRELDIELFKKSNFTKKLFGNGTDAVIKSHETKYSKGIWSHNDIFQILCGMGLFMCFLYIYEWINMIIINIKCKRFIGTMAIIVSLLVAYYNGLYIHTRLVFVLPLLFDYFISNVKKEKRNEQNFTGIM